MTPRVREILSWYGGENLALRTNIVRLFNAGTLGGTGKLTLFDAGELACSQPIAERAQNPDSYDPRYLYELAIEGGLSGMVLSYGDLQTAASEYVGELPFFLCCETNELSADWAETVLTSGCIGAQLRFEDSKEFKSSLFRLHKRGLISCVVIPDADLETMASAVQKATSWGACLIISGSPESAKGHGVSAVYKSGDVKVSSLEGRAQHLLDAGMAGRRPVLVELDPLAKEWAKSAESLASAGTFGMVLSQKLCSIPRKDALSVINQAMEVFTGQPIQRLTSS